MPFDRKADGTIAMRLLSEERAVVSRVLHVLCREFNKIDPLLFAPSREEVEALHDLIQAVVPEEETVLSAERYMLLLGAISYADDTFGEDYGSKPMSIRGMRWEFERFRRRPRAVLHRDGVGSRHPFHDELFLDGDGIELTSVYFQRVLDDQGGHDSLSQFPPGRYFYKVFLHFSDAQGNPGRIFCWCEFTTTATVIGVGELDVYALSATLDLLRDAVVPAFGWLELLWNHGSDAINELHGWNVEEARRAVEALYFDEFDFDWGYCHRRHQRELNGRIAAWQSLTAVYYHGRNEIWGTASAALTFSPETTSAERDFATYQRCKQVFQVAGGLSLEVLVAKVVEEPVKLNNVEFDLEDYEIEFQGPDL
ncbi:hypothetical protein [Novosphingobium sp. CECT 9465]|uniref:hypothetical protein n=1 Tax=Novosphingobium sp. CECT 9465 TaxID=2829794 RepID=UPI001E374EE8|nr:hypothetical protein [Novosphingobium sp. CECT 9465]CAH0496081.1 hypothetical protein NVSP9465_01109 [Novosphingobium sp. CECT 9465]